MCAGCGEEPRERSNKVDAVGETPGVYIQVKILQSSNLLAVILAFTASSEWKSDTWMLAGIMAYSAVN